MGSSVPSMAPVIRNREWRFLLRDFTDAHPTVRTVQNRVLQFVLTPVASVAWWLETFAPEVVEEAERHGSLGILLPGVSAEPCDDGRWFSFLPWMLGRPGLETCVYLVGDELPADVEGLVSSVYLPAGSTESVLRTPAAGAVRGVPRAELFNGLLGQWRQTTGRDARVDACVLFSPGLAATQETWMTESELGPFLRDGTPIGFFGYSVMDCLEDQEILGMCGIGFEPASITANPWGDEHPFSSAIGGIAGCAWRCKVSSLPAVVVIDREAFEEFRSLMEYVTNAGGDFGGDEELERMGSRVEVYEKDAPDDRDAIIVLPRKLGILESTRELGKMDHEGFRAFAPPILAPRELLSERPAESDVMRRVLWAIRAHRDWAAEATRRDDDAGLLFGGMDPAELLQGMRGFLSGVLGRDVDPDDFMRQLRLAGGVHGPTHPTWHDVFDAMGWEPDEWDEAPDRYYPAFVLRSRRRKLALPVVCEAYAYLPDDHEDDLASEAMAEVAIRYPEGAALLFKSMPYREVNGHKYQFGGMLWWQHKWTAFALNMRMKSVDDLLEQVEGGFRIGDDDPRYCDDDCSIAVPFNRMCQGLDPNEPGKLFALKSGVWTTVYPG